MAAFRADIYSMYSEHGAPGFFVTLSAADSFWPETFVWVSDGTLSVEDAKKLSVQERAKLLARHPVRAAQAWKQRVDSILNFFTKCKSKPLGNIKHYVTKAEWQTRCSEHVHNLFWCGAGFSDVKKLEDSGGRLHLGDKIELVRLAEKCFCSSLPGVSGLDKNRVIPRRHEAIAREHVHLQILVAGDADAAQQCLDLARATTMNR